MDTSQSSPERVSVTYLSLCVLYLATASTSLSIGAPLTGFQSGYPDLLQSIASLEVPEGAVSQWQSFLALSWGCQVLSSLCPSPTPRGLVLASSCHSRPLLFYSAEGSYATRKRHSLCANSQLFPASFPTCVLSEMLKRKILVLGGVASEQFLAILANEKQCNIRN